VRLWRDWSIMKLLKWDIYHIMNVIGSICKKLRYFFLVRSIGLIWSRNGSRAVQFPSQGSAQLGSPVPGLISVPIASEPVQGWVSYIHELRSVDSVPGWTFFSIVGPDDLSRAGRAFPSQEQTASSDWYCRIGLECILTWHGIVTEIR